MITQFFYIIAAYSFVIVGVLTLIGFYIWRNIVWMRRIKEYDENKKTE